MKILVECELEVTGERVRLSCDGHLVFDNRAGHFREWQRAMVGETLKAFGQANSNLAETLVR